MSIEHTIIQKLTAQFEPSTLFVDNESHRHSSGKGAESHFKITLISAQFESVRSLSRHRAVYQCLAEELEKGVHALALHLYTPAEWQARHEQIPASSNCLGHGQ